MVSATKLHFLWLDAFTFLCNKFNYIVFLCTWEQNLTNFSQEMEYTRAKGARYSGHMDNANGEHNGPLQHTCQLSSIERDSPVLYPSPSAQHFMIFFAQDKKTQYLSLTSWSVWFFINNKLFPFLKYLSHYNLAVSQVIWLSATKTTHYPIKWWFLLRVPVS